MPQAEDHKSVTWRNPDPGTQWVVDVLDAAEPFMLYNVCFDAVLRRRGSVRSGYAWIYVGVWLGVLLTLLAAEAVPWVTWIAVPVAAYRLLELLRWWLDMLIDRRHHVVVAAERNLLFLGLNLLELAFIGAIFLRASSFYDAFTSSWFASFYLVTQLSLPSVRGFWPNFGIATVEGSALVVLLGGLALIIGTVAEKLENGPWKHDHEKRLD